MSTEALALLAYSPGLGKLLEERLPPKVMEIDGEGPRVAEMEDRADEGMGPRKKRVITAIEKAAFTGKGDKPVVVQLYREYARKVNNAMADSGEGVDGKYEGKRNAAGEPEGRGVYWFADGDAYIGEWKAGEREGCGVYRFASGDVYEGEWKAGKQEGRGVFRYADGEVYSGFYKQGARVGEGIKWMADGQRAARRRDGEGVEWISLEEARQTAERLGLPLPSQRPADGNVYEGERNAAGEYEGRGVMRFANGDVYDGEYKAGKMEGRGVYRYADGDVYDGEWKAGKAEGRARRLLVCQWQRLRGHVQGWKEGGARRLPLP